MSSLCFLAVKRQISDSQLWQYMCFIYFFHIRNWSVSCWIVDYWLLTVKFTVDCGCWFYCLVLSVHVSICPSIVVILEICDIHANHIRQSTSGSNASTAWKRNQKNIILVYTSIIIHGIFWVYTSIIFWFSFWCSWGLMRLTRL